MRSVATFGASREQKKTQDISLFFAERIIAIIECTIESLFPQCLLVDIGPVGIRPPASLTTVWSTLSSWMSFHACWTVARIFWFTWIRLGAITMAPSRGFPVAVHQYGFLWCGAADNDVHDSSGQPRRSAQWPRRDEHDRTCRVAIS